MKKLKVVFALCTMMLVLCGCSMKTEYDMAINKDKSMDFSVLMAMDDELIEGMLSIDNQTGEEKEYTDDEIWTFLESTIESEENLENKGFKKVKYEQDIYKGFKYSKTISNIDNISGNTANFKLEEFQNLSDAVVFVKDGEKYKANFVLSSEEQSESTESYDVGIEMKFVVTLPNKPISHNANEVSKDGRTLTWNLLDSSSQNIEFEFSFNNDNNILLYLGIGGLAIVIAVIVAIVVMILSKNKKGGNGTSIDTTENTPVQPTIEQPQVQSVEPFIQQDVQSVQPTIEQSQVQPVEPFIQQNVQPVQPTIEQSQELPSVAEILGLPQQENNQSNNQ